MEHKIALKNGQMINRLGQGTWYMGENPTIAKSEIDTLKRGIELGINLIDTAEMYGSGKSEQLISKAISDVSREDLFVVSKVYPHNASQVKLEKSLDNSLKRLKTDYLDMYLLHWRGSVPLAETVYCMEQQVEKGKIKSWGVSNFDTEDMEELLSVENGENCALNQVLYHLGSRGTEFDLQAYLKAHNIPMMAYCPLAQAGRLDRGLFNDPVVCQLAKKYNVSSANILLNFVMFDENVIAIPKASKVAHVEDNAKALAFKLTVEDMKMLNAKFPAPTYKQYLDIV
ncbi:MAG: aldo/keto reductase [Clostridia bacterium]